MARKKIHKVIIKNETHYVFADTKQGAVRDVLAHLKETVTCEVASGLDMFYLGTIGGTIIGMPDEADVSQAILGLNEPEGDPA